MLAANCKYCTCLYIYPYQFHDLSCPLLWDKVNRNSPEKKGDYEFEFSVFIYLSLYNSKRLAGV
jgi:hypothetical protein